MTATEAACSMELKRGYVVAAVPSTEPLLERGELLESFLGHRLKYCGLLIVEPTNYRDWNRQVTALFDSCRGDRNESPSYRYYRCKVVARVVQGDGRAVDVLPMEHNHGTPKGELFLWNPGAGRKGRL